MSDTHPDAEELAVPASTAERLHGISYSAQRLVRLAHDHPDLLDSIADDLAEAYLLVVPAALHTELALEEAHDAA